MRDFLRQDRRTFLKHASAAMALGVLGQLPGSRLLAAIPVELLPDPDEALLEELALRAIDAARAAGASFADVRVTVGRQLDIRCHFDVLRSMVPIMTPPNLTYTVGYGIRTVVDGAWGIASGNDVTPDGIAQVAAAAVARAKANRPRRPRTLDLAPAEVVRNGRWKTPIAEDPFLVPVGAQADLALDALVEASMVDGVRAVTTRFIWQRANRVFASSEGTLQVQQIDLAFPRGTVTARPGEEFSFAGEQAAALRSGGYGYEIISSLDLGEELRKTAELALERSRQLTPPTPTEVGRYDLVLSGAAVAGLLTRTLAEAANAERALGYLANRVGTSFAAPPAEVLGQLQVGSPLLTVRADRSEPHAAATVGWDDEGVAPREFTIVQDGVLTDYLTTRQTAAEIGEWYRGRGEPVVSNGCASGAGQTRPSVQLPNLTMLPGRDEVSVEEIIADTKRGFYIDAVGGIADQQVLNGQFGAGGIREIRDGKLGDRVNEFAFQFITPALWKSMDVLGGPSSSVQVLAGTDYRFAGDGIQIPQASVRAVPARFRDVNVLNTGRPLT